MCSENSETCLGVYSERYHAGYKWITRWSIHRTQVFLYSLWTLPPAPPPEPPLPAYINLMLMTFTEPGVHLLHPPSCWLQSLVIHLSGTRPIWSLAKGYTISHFISRVSSGLMFLQRLWMIKHTSMIQKTSNVLIMLNEELVTKCKCISYYTTATMPSDTQIGSQLNIVVSYKITRPRTLPWLGRKQMPRRGLGVGGPRRHVP